MKLVLRFCSLLALLLLGSASLQAQNNDPFPKVNFRRYQGNMTITAKVVQYGQAVTDAVVAVYCEETIRGKETVGAGTNPNLAYLTVYGNKTGAKQQLYFKIYTSGSTLTYNPSTAITFKNNRSVGSNSEPYLIDISSGVSIAENADNTETLTMWNGKTSDVALVDRTLYKDGAWNTLCLPFSLDAAQLAASPLAGATMKVLDTEDGSYSHVTGLEDGTLYLNFKTTASITAGVPFLIRWDKPQGYDDNPDAYDIVNPLFENVTIDGAMPAAPTSADKSVSFVGFYSPYVVTGEDRTKLFLGAADMLYYPNTAVTTGSCRAFFQLGDGITVGGPESTAPVRHTILNFGDEGDTTGIASPIVSSEGKGFDSLLFQEASGETWYDLSGRRFDALPDGQGFYIAKGRKVLTK